MRKVTPVFSALATLMIASMLSGCGGGNIEPTIASVGSGVQTPSDTAAAVSTASTAAADAEALAHAAKVAAESDAAIAELQEQKVTLAEIECDGKTFDTLAAAWVRPHDICDATVTGKHLTAVQSKALKTAYGKSKDLDSLGILYSICAQNGSGAFDYMSDGGSPGQGEEVAGAMILCLSHPDHALLDKYLSKGRVNAKLTAEGRIFGPGTFLVGKDIKPGTYFVTDVDGCYWERTNRNGDTIDNYFTNGAKRVQVTIRSSDYSFNSERCGEWHPVG